MLSLENLKPKSSISLQPDPEPLVEKNKTYSFTVLRLTGCT